MQAMATSSACVRPKYVFPCGSQWKRQVYHDLTIGETRAKIVVKRTAMGKRLRFFFTMFSTSVNTVEIYESTLWPGGEHLELINYWKTMRAH